MTRPDDLETIRLALLRRRKQLAESSSGANEELAALRANGRDAEYEETAQVESASYTLITVLENQRRELQQIDAALDRLEEHRYGVCVDCELEIPYDRLTALPYSLRCAECAQSREAGHLAAHPPPSL
jgi:RNA polymerase-binding transcription factor DksA